MTRALTDLVLSFLRDKESFRASLEHPVLLWNTPPSEGTDENWQGTNPGVDGVPRSRGGEALVFDVTKDLAKKNAFTMWITVGRNDNNDIALDDGSVSRFHASIQLEAGALVLRDAESKNGTFCDGQRVERDQKVVIHDKSKLKFGCVEVTFLAVESLFAMLEQMMGAEQAPSDKAAALGQSERAPRASQRTGHDRPTIESAPDSTATTPSAKTPPSK